MIGELWGVVLTMGALAAFAAIALIVVQRSPFADRDHYLTARGTQGTVALGLSFFASALGAWILFSPPEVGTFAGLLGISGYALGQALAVVVFAGVGPRVRALAPSGTTLLGFVRARFGRANHVYVAAVSLLYMFVFLAAELTAIGGVLSLLAGVDPLVPIVAVAAVTAAYTAYGGLPASLVTDRWQAWLVLGLAAAAAVVIAADVAGPGARAEAAGLTRIDRPGAEVLVVLVIAIVAANLFHQGFWQRVWSAHGERELRRGVLLGGVLILPVVFAAGLAGMVAAGGTDVETPSLALFSLLETIPAPAVALVVVLAVALVASSVDTLQNAIAALIATDLTAATIGTAGARVLTVLLTVPAAAIAAEGLSVLRLFLVADLLAATIALPVFLGLWAAVGARSALAGAVAGLVAVVAAGWIDGTSVVDGFRLVTLPDGPSFDAFVAAVAGSGLVTGGLAVSAAAHRRILSGP
jgi:solute:Na+ symporter, SSS family